MIFSVSHSKSCLLTRVAGEMDLNFVLSLFNILFAGNSLQQNGSPTRSSRSPSHPELPVELQKYAEIHFSHLSPKDLRQLDESNGNDEVEHRLKDLELQNWRKNKTSILETIFMKAKVALLRKQVKLRLEGLDIFQNLIKDHDRTEDSRKNINLFPYQPYKGFTTTLLACFVIIDTFIGKFFIGNEWIECVSTSKSTW